MVKAPTLEELVTNLEVSNNSKIMLFEICSGTLSNNLNKKQDQVINHKKNLYKIMKKQNKDTDIYTTVLFVNGKDIEDHLNEINASINYILYGNLQEVTSSVSNYYLSRDKELFNDLNKIKSNIDEVIINTDKKNNGTYGYELEDYIYLILKDQISLFSKDKEYHIFKRIKYRKNGDIDVLSVFDETLICKELNPKIFKNFERKFGFNFIKKHNRVFMYNNHIDYKKK